MYVQVIYTYSFAIVEIELTSFEIKYFLDIMIENKLKFLITLLCISYKINIY